MAEGSQHELREEQDVCVSSVSNNGVKLLFLKFFYLLTCLLTKGYRSNSGLLLGQI